MKRFIVYAASLALALTLPFGAQAAEDKFLKEAADHNLAEVQLGKLASERAQSDDVKKFAKRMVDDHQKAYDEVKQLAQSKNVQVPSEVSAAKKKEHDRLARMQGAEFDRAYMQMMVREHNHDVKTFQDKSKNAKDADVKNWVGQTLPTLQDHQQMAKDVANQMQAGAKADRPRGSASPATTPETKASGEKKP
jgi:putative membrane protein